MCVHLLFYFLHLVHFHALFNNKGEWGVGFIILKEMVQNLTATHFSKFFTKRNLVKIIKIVSEQTNHVRLYRHWQLMVDGDIPSFLIEYY